MLASQAGYFSLGYFRVMSELPPSDFMMIRKSTDAAIRNNLRILYLLALAAALLVLIMHRHELGSLRGILICVSVLCLVADIIIAKTGSERINAVINDASIEILVLQPQLQTKWLQLLAIRGGLSIAGFLLLIASIVFTKKFI